MMLKNTVWTTIWHRKTDIIFISCMMFLGAFAYLANNDFERFKHAQQMKSLAQSLEISKMSPEHIKQQQQLSPDAVFINKEIRIPNNEKYSDTMTVFTYKQNHKPLYVIHHSYINSDNHLMSMWKTTTNDNVINNTTTLQKYDNNPDLYPTLSTTDLLPTS